MHVCPTAAAAETGAAAPITEIVVNGERAGPRLWRIQSDTAQLWILGTVSPLPVGMTWRAREVERVLDEAQTVLLAKPLEISVPAVLWMLVAHRDRLMIPHGRELKDVLSPELYQKFAAQRSAYGKASDRWERYRPIIAAALLEDAALKRNGLSERLDVSLAVRRLARQRHVPIEEVAVPAASELLEALSTIAPDLEGQCFDLVLTTIATRMPQLAARAAAWANGDVAQIASLPRSTEAACGAALRGDPRTAHLLEGIHAHWLAALDAHLRGRGVALAVVDMDALLGREGLLRELQTEGYRADGPLQD